MVHYRHMALERSIQLKVLLSPAEKRMLAQLAKGGGLTVSDVVRQLVRRAHAETQTRTTRAAKLSPPRTG